jgi:proline dehydrogenase
MKLLYPLAKRFIAGHNLNSAKPIIKNLIMDGYEVSIDYVGESSKSIQDCEKAKYEYIKIINAFRYEKIDISIKPSHLGILLDTAIPRRQISYLAKLAAKNNHTIRLDMEGSEVTQPTIDLAIYLNKRWGNVGVALQANLHRTKEDLKLLIRNNVSVRLVKGAYKESSNIAHQNELNIGSCFYGYAVKLSSTKANKPAVATHDEELLDDIEELIPNPEYFDYEFLYGIRRDLQEKFKNKGYKVRVYVPFGENWLPYTLRRLKEWKNLIFVIKNIVKEWCK